MISRLVVVLVLCTSPLAGQQRLARGMAVDRDVAIRLWVPAGFVEVQGWDRDSVDVRVTPAAGTTLTGGGSRSAAKFALETTRGDNVLPSATMRVMVPRGVRLWIKSTTANVSVQGVRGELDVLQVSGSILIVDGRGVVRAESIDGNITMNRVSGALNVRGGAGKIDLGTVSGTLQLSAVSGAVTLGERINPNVSPSSALVANLETVGGEVHIVGRWHPDSRLDITTHDGPVTIVPVSVALSRVESTVPGAVIPQALRTASGAGGVITVRSFKGKLNVVPPSGI